VTQAQTAAWDREPDVEDVSRSLVEHIAARSIHAEMTPMAKIALDGALGVGDLRRIEDQLGGIEIVAPHRLSPVEYLVQRGTLSDLEQAVCRMYRLDYDMAMDRSSGVMNYDAIGFHATEQTRQDQKRGWTGKGAARTVRARDIGAARLTAMQRRGAFARDHYVAAWLAEAIIGREMFPSALEGTLGCGSRQIMAHFRVALAELAAFYRLAAQAKPRPRGITSWNDGDMAK
jgi:hypothetical protein